MTGLLTAPTKYRERRRERGQGQIPVIDQIIIGASITPDGTAVGGPVIYTAQEHCAFSLDDFRWGSQAFYANRPRVSYDQDAEGRAVNVALVP